MKAILITIGDEILIGQTVNTNASYIGAKLSDINIEVIRTAVITDDKESILAEFQKSVNDAEIVVVTGGLGPTHDDVTKACIAEFFNTELELSESILSDIKSLFEKRGRTLTPSNEEQAMFPKIAEPIRNPRGTAPGIWIQSEKGIFAAMPGVPYEMKGMMEDFVLPRLRDKMGSSKIVLRSNLMTTGIPESYLYERLGDLDELLNGAKLAFLPSQFGVKMRLTVEAENIDSAKESLSDIEQRIRSKVGRFIYSKDEENLENVVVRLLHDRVLTLAIAESCTGGLIAARITNVPGSSNVFERGFITYSNGAKVENLNVDEDYINEFGAVSIEVARQMAQGVRAVSGTDLGLAVTGIMGPSGGSQEKPVGTVYIGICDDKFCSAKKYVFGEDRLLNKDRTAQAALDLIRRHILGIEDDE